MRVLIACEESQEVCKAFRKMGHFAFSCDLQSCSGGHPEWHIKGDCIPLLNGFCSFSTEDGSSWSLPCKWDLIIAHPPCTYLTTAANQCHSLKVFNVEYIINRTYDRIEAMVFFMKIITADCDKIAVENPQGVMNTCFRKPDQVIHPYYFASSISDSDNFYTKKTCLWLKGLRPLVYSSVLPDPLSFASSWKSGKRKNWTESVNGSKVRSKTFPGIAAAMANQWGGPCN